MPASLFSVDLSKKGSKYIRLINSWLQLRIKARFLINYGDQPGWEWRGNPGDVWLPNMVCTATRPSCTGGLIDDGGWWHGGQMV